MTHMKGWVDGRKREGINGRTDERTEHMKGWMDGRKKKGEGKMEG
jgi:hypothetical protein